MTGSSPHEHFGPNAEREPDTLPRAYHLDVLLNGIPEAVGVTLMHQIADLLVEHGMAMREPGDPPRAIIGLRPHDWSADTQEMVARAVPGGTHIVLPKAVPQSPDLGLGYSPN